MGPALGGALAGSFGPVALFATSSLNDGATLKPLGGSEGPGGYDTHPLGQKKKEGNFSAFFFSLRGGSGGGLGGSPGLPGGPGEPRGALGGPGGVKNPILLKIRFSINIGLKIGRRHRPKAF